MHAVRPARCDTAVVAPVALGGGLVLLWQLLTGAGVLDPFYFSRPSAIAARVGDWLVSGFLWGHLSVTLVEALYGLVLGVLLGLVVASSSPAQRSGGTARRVPSWPSRRRPGGPSPASRI